MGLIQSVYRIVDKPLLVEIIPKYDKEILRGKNPYSNN